MTLREARKLKPGQIIEWRDRFDWRKSKAVFKGRVLWVTERGGIRVTRPGGTQGWAPYHCVYDWETPR